MAFLQRQKNVKSRQNKYLIYLQTNFSTTKMLAFFSFNKITLKTQIIVFQSLTKNECRFSTSKELFSELYFVFRTTGGQNYNIIGLL